MSAARRATARRTSAPSTPPARRGGQKGGVELIELKGGDAGKSLLVLETKNNAAAGQTALPAGIAAVLSSISTATVRSRG